MGVYLWTEQTIYDWMLWWRPLQSDLKDYSWNENDWSWYSGTGTFSTVAGKTGARCTKNSSYLTTQSVITTLNYQSLPITVCGWICFNTRPNSPSNNPRNWLMSSSNGSWKWYTLWTRPSDSFYPVAAFGTSLRIASSVPSINTWYFWSATFEWTTMKTYFNWNLANTSTSATLGTAWWVWKLWCAMIDSWQTVNNGLDGWIRHCAVWNRVLSGDEIQAFYNQTT